jgi:hypothetical protein
MAGRRVRHEHTVRAARARSGSPPKPRPGLHRERRHFRSVAPDGRCPNQYSFHPLSLLWRWRRADPVASRHHAAHGQHVSPAVSRTLSVRSAGWQFEGRPR